MVDSSKKTTFNLVLDPGHGGKDSGACANGLAESHKVLQLAVAAKYNILKRDSSIGITLTRNLDIKPTFAQRATVAREACADLVVSLHLNASANTNVGGLWLFAQHGNNWSHTLCESVKLNPPSYFKNIRVWDAHDDPKIDGDEWLQRPANVLEKYGTTALLLEWGFVTNVEDAVYLKSTRAALDLTETLLSLVSEYRRLSA
jgi:N-acetylmuramoyl-L-alanine amidase